MTGKAPFRLLYGMFQHMGHKPKHGAFLLPLFNKTVIVFQLLDEGLRVLVEVCAFGWVKVKWTLDNG